MVGVENVTLGDANPYPPCPPELAPSEEFKRAMRSHDHQIDCTECRIKFHCTSVICPFTCPDCTLKYEAMMQERGMNDPK